MEKNLKTWLWGGWFLVLSMIVLGGYTRLSGSGLSITEWNVLMGILPPLSEMDWAALFQKYQETPEFLKVNFAMSLQEFKSIFWAEYFHRILGRIIGLYFLYPLYLLIMKKLALKDFRKYIVGFLLVCMQGVLGWFMVKSGLKNIPHVNPFFLSSHLIMASFLILWIVWTIENRPKINLLILAVLLFEIFLGGLVAGFKGGYIYNTFPLMGNGFVPPEIQNISDLFINPAGVQFFHRIWMCVVVGAIVFTKQYKLTALLGVQVILGIATLLLDMNMILALFHQLNAFLLLTGLVVLRGRF